MRKDRGKMWDANPNYIHSVYVDGEPGCVGHNSDTCDSKSCHAVRIKEFEGLGTFCKFHFLTLPKCSRPRCAGIAVRDKYFNPKKLCRECLMEDEDNTETVASLTRWDSSISQCVEA